jgi:biotin carboxyl carrier protein
MLRRYSIELAGKEHDVAVEALENGRYRVIVDGREQVVDARAKPALSGSISWSILADNGHHALIDIDRGATGDDYHVTSENVTAPAKVTDVRRKLAASQTQGARRAKPRAIVSPMPGKVVKVLVKAGDAVTAGQGVIVVEAMKMENELKAAADGKVKAVKVKEGEAVDASQTLIELE